MRRGARPGRRAVASAIAGLADRALRQCEAAVSVQGQTLSSQAGDLGDRAILSVALIALWTYGCRRCSRPTARRRARDGVVGPCSRPGFARRARRWRASPVRGSARARSAPRCSRARSGSRRGPPAGHAPPLRAGLGSGSRVGVAALAMTVSLSLPRAATLLPVRRARIPRRGCRGRGAARRAPGRPARRDRAPDRPGSRGRSPRSRRGSAKCNFPVHPRGRTRERWPGRLATGALVARFRRLELPR
jgi:hypothetical protein